MCVRQLCCGRARIVIHGDGIVGVAVDMVAVAASRCLLHRFTVKDPFEAGQMMTKRGMTHRQIFQVRHPHEVYVGEAEMLEASETAEQPIWQVFPHVAVAEVDQVKFIQAQEKLLREPSQSVEVAGVEVQHGRHVPQQLLREREESIVLDVDRFDGACSREAKGVVV